MYHEQDRQRFVDAVNNLPGNTWTTFTDITKLAKISHGRLAAFLREAVNVGALERQTIKKHKYTLTSYRRIRTLNLADNWGFD